MPDEPRGTLKAVYEAVGRLYRQTGAWPYAQAVGRVTHPRQEENAGRYLKQLVAAGLLEEVGAGPRPAYKQVAGGPGFPLLGKVSAGPPRPVAEPLAERVDFNQWLGDDGCFTLDVDGDSMVGAGILDGDRVTLRPADTAESGDVVVASVRGAVTLKEYTVLRGVPWLSPYNDAVDPIKLDGPDCRIVGVLVGVARRVARPKKRRKKA